MPETLPIKYRAFLSYAHADKRWAWWLHDRPEAFAIAKELRGRETRPGPVPASLKPIVLDRGNFAGGSTLTEATVAALDASAALIVVCSPVAAGRPAVGEEVRLFRFRHPDRPVIPVIVDGTHPDYFPPALRFALNWSARRQSPSSAPTCARAVTAAHWGLPRWLPGCSASTVPMTSTGARRGGSARARERERRSRWCSSLWRRGAGSSIGRAASSAPRLFSSRRKNPPRWPSPTRCSAPIPPRPPRRRQGESRRRPHRHPAIGGGRRHRLCQGLRAAEGGQGRRGGAAADRRRRGQETPRRRRDQIVRQGLPPSRRHRRTGSCMPRLLGWTRMMWRGCSSLRGSSSRRAR